MWCRETESDAVTSHYHQIVRTAIDRFPQNRTAASQGATVTGLSLSINMGSGILFFFGFHFPGRRTAHFLPFSAVSVANAVSLLLSRLDAISGISFTFSIYFRFQLYKEFKFCIKRTKPGWVSSFCLSVKLPAVPVVTKSFSYEQKKYPPSSKIEVGLPTTAKRRRRNQE